MPSGGTWARTTLVFRREQVERPTDEKPLGQLRGFAARPAGITLAGQDPFARPERGPRLSPENNKCLKITAKPPFERSRRFKSPSLHHSVRQFARRSLVDHSRRAFIKSRPASVTTQGRKDHGTPCIGSPCSSRWRSGDDTSSTTCCRRTRYRGPASRFAHGWRSGIPALLPLAAAASRSSTRLRISTPL